MTFVVQSMLMVLFLLLQNFLDFAELDEFIYRLESHPGLVLDLLVVDHLVHVVGRNGADDVLVLLVVPDLSVFVEAAFVELVKQGKRAGFVVFLLFLFVFLLLLLCLADQQNLFALLCRSLLLDFLLGLYIKIIGVVEVLCQILGLLGLFCK